MLGKEILAPVEVGSDAEGALGAASAAHSPALQQGEEELPVLELLLLLM